MLPRPRPTVQPTVRTKCRRTFEQKYFNSLSFVLLLIHCFFRHHPAIGQARHSKAQHKFTATSAVAEYFDHTNDNKGQQLGRGDFPTMDEHPVIINILRKRPFRVGIYASRDVRSSCCNWRRTLRQGLDADVS